jgi:DNA repair protein RadA/Sms
MLLAVLQKHGVPVHDRNIFVNVTGGIHINEPAADLAIALAVFSSFTDEPLPSDCLILGELGLVGEVRSVPQPLLRMKEAARYGFMTAIAHDSACELDQSDLRITGVKRFADVLSQLS